MNKGELVYLDTSVISAYFDRRNEPRMVETRKFWHHLESHLPCISNVVHEELSRMSNPEVKRKVLHLIKDFRIYTVTEKVLQLATDYIDEGIIPEKSFNDAIHIAVATVNNVSVLVSWNFHHIVKRNTKSQVNLLNSIKGYKNLEIVSPLDF